MYDFGLARRYVDKNNQIIPSRKEVGWRGTTRYGSLNAHKRQDLGRRDDLESWFYGLVEMTRGTLPWRNVVGKRGGNHGDFDMLSEISHCFNLIYFQKEIMFKEQKKLLDWLGGLNFYSKLRVNMTRFSL